MPTQHELEAEREKALDGLIDFNRCAGRVFSSAELDRFKRGYRMGWDHAVTYIENFVPRLEAEAKKKKEDNING